MFLPLRSKTRASGVYNCKECSLISPGWSGSAGISGVELPAAAFDVAVSLFVSGVERIHSSIYHHHIGHFFTFSCWKYFFQFDQ